MRHLKNLNGVLIFKISAFETGNQSAKIILKKFGLTFLKRILYFEFHLEKF